MRAAVSAEHRRQHAPGEILLEFHMRQRGFRPEPQMVVGIVNRQRGFEDRLGHPSRLMNTYSRLSMQR